jgi:hypothetical protein
MPTFLQQTLKDSQLIPCPEVSLPWMRKHRLDLSYASKQFWFERKVVNTPIHNVQSPERFYENRLYETTVAVLLNQYLKKNYPDAKLFVASEYDDIFSGSDFIVCVEDAYVRIDLTMGRDRIKSFEENLGLQTIDNKVYKFHNRDNIPHEFFNSVKPGMPRVAMPLIILRVDQPILSSFIRNYFEELIHSENNGDILACFGTWMQGNMDIYEERIAYILWLTKTSKDYDVVEELIMHIGVLFAWVHNVSTESVPFPYSA